MRFGISATSWIFPKNLRTRLRPVNVCAISSLALSNRRGRNDSPEGRHPSRPSGQPSKPLILRDSAAAEPPCRHRHRAEIWTAPGFAHPQPSATNSHLFELHLRSGLLQLGLDLLGLLLVNAFLDRFGCDLGQVIGLLDTETGKRADIIDN